MPETCFNVDLCSRKQRIAATYNTFLHGTKTSLILVNLLRANFPKRKHLQRSRTCTLSKRNAHSNYTVYVYFRERCMHYKAHSAHGITVERIETWQMT